MSDSLPVVLALAIVACIVAAVVVPLMLRDALRLMAFPRAGGKYPNEYQRRKAERI